MSKIWHTLNSDAQKLALFGTNLQVITNFGDNFQGTLYYYDENAIILKNDEDYILINQEQIKDFQPISIQDQKTTLQQLLQVDLGKLSQEMIKQDMKEPHQLLYDHLLKLYRDVEWKDDEIIIPSIQIRITPPYKSDNIFGDNKKAVDRLKKIIVKYSKA